MKAITSKAELFLIFTAIRFVLKPRLILVFVPIQIVQHKAQKVSKMVS